LERTLGAAPTSLRDAAWRSTPTLTQRPARLAGERLLLVGDPGSTLDFFVSPHLLIEQAVPSVRGELQSTRL
ncbi:MAG: hypothetical protein AAGC99_21940, partial [Pseudomonadota bacterium]